MFSSRGVARRARESTREMSRKTIDDVELQRRRTSDESTGVSRGTRKIRPSGGQHAFDSSARLHALVRKPIFERLSSGGEDLSPQVRDAQQRYFELPYL
jgi:hypothetical protein